MEGRTEDEVKEYIKQCREEGKIYSVEHLRRALHIGYKKAKRVFDEMEGLTDENYRESPPRKRRRSREVTAIMTPPAPERAPEKLQDMGLDLATVAEVLKKLRRHENAWPFNQPVDPVALNVPDYLDIVKQPMDLGTVEDKINKGVYQDAAQVLADVDLVWSNCYLYNSPEHVVCFWATELAEEFKRMLNAAKRGKPQDIANKGIDISEVTGKRKRTPTQKLILMPEPTVSKRTNKDDAKPKADGRKRAKKEKSKEGDVSQDRSEAKWTERLAELTAFKERFGHCRVMRSWEENPQLGQWVHDMRQYRRKGILKKDREDKLNALGFVWSCRQGPSKGSSDEVEEEEGANAVEYDNDESKWEERFELLKDYKEKYGNCKVPKRFEEDPQLGLWVADMRVKRRMGELDEAWEKKLNSVGFVWNFQAEWNKNWEERFRQIKAYKDKWGHCTIPKNVPSLKQLAQWVRDVRKNRRKGKLSEDRIRKLDKIGFVWNPSKKRAITANGPPRTYEGLDQLASLASEAELLEVEVEKDENESNESSDNSPDDEEKDVGDSTSTVQSASMEGLTVTTTPSETAVTPAASEQPASSAQQEPQKVEAEEEDEKMSADEESKIRLLGEWGSRIVEDKAADSDTESDDGKKRKWQAWY